PTSSSARPSSPSRRSSDLVRRRLLLVTGHLGDGQGGRTGGDQRMAQALHRAFARIDLPAQRCHGYGRQRGQRALTTDKTDQEGRDRKSTRLNSSHVKISYA